MSDSVKIKVPAMLEPGSGPYIADAKSINDELTIGTQKLTNQHAINAKLLELLNTLLEDGTIDNTNYATIISLLNSKVDKEGSLSMGDVSGNPVPAIIYSDIAIQAKTDEKGNNLYQMYLRLQDLGVLNNLNTAQKNTLVDAINSLLSLIESNKFEVGDLEDLNTESDSVVSSINKLEDFVKIIKQDLLGSGNDQKLPYRIINGTIQNITTVLNDYCGISEEAVKLYSGHFRYFLESTEHKGCFIDVICVPIEVSNNLWLQVAHGLIEFSTDGTISFCERYYVWYRVHTVQGWSEWKNDLVNIEATIGQLSELQTSRKDSIVRALNSLKSDISDRLDRLDERANGFDDSVLELQAALEDFATECRDYTDLTVGNAIDAKLVTIEPEVWNDGENDLEFKEGAWIGVFEEE